MIYEFDSKSPSIHPSAYIADSAVIIGDVVIGERCYVGPGAVIRADEKKIIIGNETAVEDGVIIHAGGPKCDCCMIGNNVTIGHGAIIHGNRLADGANIGMGAIVSIYAQVGEDAVVAEGSVVKKGQLIPPRVVVGGTPASVLRTLEDKDIAAWKRSNQTYIELAAKCRNPGILKRLD